MQRWGMDLSKEIDTLATAPQIRHFCNSKPWALLDENNYALLRRRIDVLLKHRPDDFLNSIKEDIEEIFFRVTKAYEMNEAKKHEIVISNERRGKRYTTLIPSRVQLACGTETPHNLMEEVERAAYKYALDICLGNRTAACRILGISVRTLRNKLNKWGVAHCS